MIVYTIKEISVHAKSIFQGAFNPTLFLKQLSYFSDINYSEVEYMPGFEIPDEEIKEFLIEKLLEGF